MTTLCTFKREQRIAGTSRGAGVPVNLDQGYVWTIRNGQAVRFRWFRTPGQALEAMGLSG